MGLYPLILIDSLCPGNFLPFCQCQLPLHRCEGHQSRKHWEWNCVDSRKTVRSERRGLPEGGCTTWQDKDLAVVFSSDAYESWGYKVLVARALCRNVPETHEECPWNFSLHLPPQCGELMVCRLLCVFGLSWRMQATLFQDRIENRRHI